MSLYQEYEPTPDNPCEIKGFRWLYENDRRERMKVIDLLNKIANGEEVPEYINYINRINNKMEMMLVCKGNIIYKLDQLIIGLNDEVEIIEEEPKHIEELDILPDNESYSNKVLYGKINELAEAVNYLLDKEGK